MSTTEDLTFSRYRKMLKAEKTEWIESLAQTEFKDVYGGP